MEAGHIGEGQPETSGQGHGGDQSQIQVIVEKQAEQEADDRTAEHSQFTEHVLVGNPLLARLRLGEALAEHHQAVADDRHEEEGDLVLPGERLGQRLPAEDALAGEDDREQAPHDQAAGPTGVEDVQVVRPIAREQRGDQRVDDRLGDPVADGEEEHPPEEALEGGRLAP